MLYGAICLATCLAILEKEIKLQKTCYTLQSRATTCNGLCNRCKRYNRTLLCIIVASPEKLWDKLKRGHVTRCNLFLNAIATQVAKKIAPCNTSLRARIYLLQRLQGFLQTIASCSKRLERVFWNHWKLQPKIARCNTSSITCNGFLFPTLRDKLQGNLHHVTLALVTRYVCHITTFYTFRLFILQGVPK